MLSNLVPKSGLTIYIRYGVVGTLNVLFYLVTAHILLKCFEFNFMLVTTIAFILTSCLSFFINIRHVFYREIGFASYFKYLAVLLVALVLTNIIMSCAAFWGAGNLVSQLLAIVVTVPFTFVLSRFFVFNSK